MSDLDRFKIIQKQCQRVSKWIHEAEMADDAATAAKLYGKARNQMDKVTEAVRANLGQTDLFTTA